MNGLQYLGLLLMLGIAAFAAHLDRHKWSRLQAPDDEWPTVADADRAQLTPVGVLRETRNPADDAWFAEISGWVAEQDTRSGVYAQVSRDVAAHRAHVEGSAA